jgi:hypothetical protein
MLIIAASARPAPTQLSVAASVSAIKFLAVMLKNSVTYSKQKATQGHYWDSL